MRVVADTNTVLSGLLWQGAPRQVLDAARAGTITLYTSAVLLAELKDVLNRPKFAERLKLARVQAKDLILGFTALATIVEPADIAPAVAADPDDDAVLACALAAQAHAIVSGDSDLLRLKKYVDIPILTAPELLDQLAESDSE
ncbi:MAG: putative toxin-antitoxin system toxin component, PIN family [Chloroflexota bacterium]|nr:putative toxin-antitoxin system toxin component, PIN family [Chloroflexota bacterium]